ncbi:hypothetical protein ES703_110056 [subsurface metagenome]
MGNKLTPREVEILNLVRLGNSNRMIASRLGLSIGTIKSHLMTIFLRLGAMNRTDAIIKAHKAGYIKIE